MNHKDFTKYWKKRKSEKHYSNYVPSFKKLKTLEIMINELKKVEAQDFRKMKHEHRIVIMERIFGKAKKQYNVKTLSNEINNSINIGKQRIGI